MGGLTRLISVVCDPKSVIMLLSTLVFVWALLLSFDATISADDFTCTQAPQLYITNDTATAISHIKAILNSSTKYLTIISPSFMEPNCVGDYFATLRDAHKRGVAITIMAYTNPVSTEALKKVASIFQFDSEYWQPSGDVIISESKAIIMNSIPRTITGRFSNPTSSFQLLEFNNCLHATKTLEAFFHLYHMNSTSSTPTIIPAVYQSRASLANQLRIGTSNEYLYLFHNPPEFYFPLSHDTEYILKSTLARQPKHIKYFTHEVPSLLEYQNPTENSFYMYIFFKTLLMTNKTRIDVLSAADFQAYEQPWSDALNGFDKCEIRTYKRPEFGPEYLLIDGRCFIFTHLISRGMLNTHLSIHMSTNASSVCQVAEEHFDSLWGSV